MKVARQHRWDVSTAEARRIRDALIPLRRDAPAPARIRHVAGADVSYERWSDRFHAAVVVLAYPSLEIVEVAAAEGTVRFPYVPGYLTFREGPVVLQAFERLRTRPDVVVFDGHGVAHPGRFGIAAHLGVLLDLPSIGCAKSRLVGEYLEPASRRGSRRPLLDRGEVIGKVLRTREGVRPVFVSVGHRMRLDDACRLLLRCVRKVRIPEPTRLAHIEVNRRRRACGDRAQPRR